MNNYSGLIERIKQFVERLFDEYQGQDLIYHNLQHTKTVVQRTFEIERNYSLSQTENFILSASAWFHDTGHLAGGAMLHEDRSVTIMHDFLKLEGVEKDSIDMIESCNLLNKAPTNPKILIRRNIVQR